MASKNLNVLDNTTVINDLLFFIINKFEILNNVTCVDKCVEYYSANLISESKDLILGDTARFLEQKEKKTRKLPGSKSSPKNDLEEIVNVIKICRERNLMDKLPHYVAGNFNFPDLTGVYNLNINNSGTTNIDVEAKLNLLTSKIENLTIVIDNIMKVLNTTDKTKNNNNFQIPNIDDINIKLTTLTNIVEALTTKIDLIANKSDSSQHVNHVLLQPQLLPLSKSQQFHLPPLQPTQDNHPTWADKARTPDDDGFTSVHRRTKRPRTQTTDHQLSSNKTPQINNINLIKGKNKTDNTLIQANKKIKKSCYHVGKLAKGKV